jgi:hypothetical protein
MKKGMLIGIVVIVVLWVGLLIAVTIEEPTFIVGTLIEGILVGAWIYLIMVVWKKETSLFHAEMKPELAERRLKSLKTWLVVTGISLAVVHGGWFEGFLESYYLGTSDPVAPFIAIFLGIPAFIAGSIGSLVVFLRGRRKPT